MTEIEFTLPTAQYANVKVRATPEELGLHGVDNAYELGVAAAVYLNLFTQGYKVGGAMDVVPPSGAAKAPLAASEGEVDQVIQETLEKAQALADGRKEARQIIEKELGGVTEISEEEFDAKVEAAEAEMGGKVPWEAEVAAPKKPWEIDDGLPKAKPVVTADW